MVETVIIPHRFRGPPHSANGGYACGVVARRIGGPARVKLRQPPPLDVPLELRDAGGGVVRLTAGETVIAEGEPARVSIVPPAPVSFEEAVRGARNYAWKQGHPFSGCFVCGPDRDPGDGLCIFPGVVEGRPVVAAPWIPDATVCDNGVVRSECVWAALDCPSWFAILAFEPGVFAGLLGQMTAEVKRAPAKDEPCIAMAWPLGRDGRKLYSGAALHTAEGKLLGASEAIWIEPKVKPETAAAVGIDA
jgi:hypothetical protein